MARLEAYRCESCENEGTGTIKFGKVHEITGCGIREEDGTNLCSGFSLKDLDASVLKELGYEELSEEQKQENLEYNLCMLELDKKGR